MSAADQRRVTTIKIRVHDGARIDWTVADNVGSPMWDPEEMSLSEPRRQTISLLADLLRSSTDIKITATDLEKTLDKEGQNLYSRLLLIMGHELFDLLFVGQLRSYLFDALRQLRDARLDRLRIELTFTGNQEEWLAGLPWEYTRTPPGDKAFNPRGVFLSHLAELILSRRLNMESFRPLSSDQWPVPVLLVCSSPPGGTDEGLEPVDAYGVLENLEKLAERGVVRLETLIEPPRPAYPGPAYKVVVTHEAFQRKVLEFRPVVIHFIGHGHCANGTGELAFAHPDGTVDWVDDEHFERDVSKSRRLSLVFLQACKSALPDPYVSFSGVARAVAASGVPAVVGIQYQITQAAANTFAEAFYDGIFDEEPVSNAVQAARNTIAEMTNDDHLAFGLPVLYLSNDDILAHPPTHPPTEASAIGRTARVDRRDQAGKTLVCPRPRCSAELAGPTQKFCQNCGLRLICPEPGCGERYVDPVNDKYCRNCQAPVRQLPYMDDALDVVAKVSDSDVARAALTVLRGPGPA